MKQDSSEREESGMRVGQCVRVCVNGRGPDNIQLILTRI